VRYGRGRCAVGEREACSRREEVFGRGEEVFGTRGEEMVRSPRIHFAEPIPQEWTRHYAHASSRVSVPYRLTAAQ
jgi:hypothetical protein